MPDDTVFYCERCGGELKKLSASVILSINGSFTHSCKSCQKKFKPRGYEIDWEKERAEAHASYEKWRQKRRERLMKAVEEEKRSKID